MVTVDTNVLIRFFFPNDEVTLVLLVLILSNYPVMRSYILLQFEFSFFQN